MSDFTELCFITDVAADDEPPQLKRFCITLPKGETRERLLSHPDAKGYSPYIYDFETLLRRTLRRETLLRQASEAGLG